MASDSYNSTVCVYTPLSKVDWSGAEDYGPCGNARWRPHNPFVYWLLGFFHGMAYWMAIRLSLQVAVTFKRWNTIYFWY